MEEKVKERYVWREKGGGREGGKVTRCFRGGEVFKASHI